jgi:hypothetical protein
VLRDIIASTKLDPHFCAALVGVSPDQFDEWMTGSRPVPSFVIPELSTVLGVPEKQIVATRQVLAPNREYQAPAIWYKLRDEKLTDSDREMVGLVRKLGFFVNQLQVVKGRRSLGYIALFAAVRDDVDKKLSPAEQGKAAASRFRDISGLHHGRTGIGELIRPFLRRQGVLLVESPLPKSSLEGCCFSVGSDSSATPCIFANSYKSTWFHRNAVVLHEICHGMFDLDSDPVSVDFRDNEGGLDTYVQFKEARARAFAQECMVPSLVLAHFASQFGIKWQSLSARELGRIVANTHAEQRLVLRAALDASFIDREQYDRYSGYECERDIRDFSDHALSTREYLRSRTEESPRLWVAENRKTDLGTRKLRLPVGYIHEVLSTLNAGQISLGKAAEMAMMEKRTFCDRFRDLIQETE